MSLIKWIKEWIFNDPPLVVWHSDGRREVSKKPKQKTVKRPH
jgi:hypothetical protein